MQGQLLAASVTYLGHQSTLRYDVTAARRTWCIGAVPGNTVYRLAYLAQAYLPATHLDAGGRV